MKKLSLLLALTCGLSACTSSPAGAPATGTSEAAVSAMAPSEGTVQATIGLQLAGPAQRRIMAAGTPWTAADLSAVRVHLFRNTGTAWVEVGNGAGLTFAAGSYDLSGPLTLTFAGLAHSTPYRIVAIAIGDDGGTSTDAAGAALPDVSNVSTGTRRADRHFASDVAAIASGNDERNRFDFTTGTAPTLDLRTGLNATVFNLQLRDKYFSGAASGVAVTVQPGTVQDPADTAVQISSTLVVGETLDISSLLYTTGWYDTGVVLSSGQDFRIQASANASGNGDGYYDGSSSKFISVDGDPEQLLGGCWVPNTGSLGYYGAVIGRIGATGEPFAVGSERPFGPAEGNGHLFVAINNVGGGPDNGGTVNVTVSTR